MSHAAPTFDSPHISSIIPAFHYRSSNLDSYLETNSECIQHLGESFLMQCFMLYMGNAWTDLPFPLWWLMVILRNNQSFISVICFQLMTSQLSDKILISWLVPRVPFCTVQCLSYFGYSESPSSSSTSSTMLIPAQFVFMSMYLPTLISFQVVFLQQY